MENQSVKRPELKPLKITCTSSDCERSLHCFKKSRKMVEADRGKCRACGANLIDWKRVHKRDVKDAQYTFDALKMELFRHHFWHEEIDEKAIRHAKRKGRKGLIESARNRLIKKVAVTNNRYDGLQTPFEGNIIFYAQHALACCCRKCIEYWHGIPVNKEMDENQIEYFVDMIMMYIENRMPDLTENGEYVPRITIYH